MIHVFKFKVHFYLSVFIFKKRKVYVETRLASSHNHNKITSKI